VPYWTWRTPKTAEEDVGVEHASLGFRTKVDQQPNTVRKPMPAALVSLQRGPGNRAVAQLLSIHRVPAIQRDPASEADYRSYIETLVSFFNGAASAYAAREHLMIVDRSVGLPTPPPEATLQQIAQILPRWTTAYDNGQQVIRTSLHNEAGLANRLRSSYESALSSLHKLARHAPRVNVVLIAAPGGDDDRFIAHAAAYARTYYGQPASPGDTVVVIEGVSTLDGLLGGIETANPERMIRRVDIFAHGTINPSNQLKLAGRWHTTGQLQDALGARQLTSQYLQSATRFDATSTVEFHGCRLGGGEGEEFLRAAGQAMGGGRAQEVVGYRQRLFPQRIQLEWRGNPVVSTTRDIYGSDALPISAGRGSSAQRQANRDRFIRDFEAHAIRVFDGAVAGSTELRTFATARELAAGVFSRERKIEIMRAMYDADGAWQLAFLHPAHAPDANVDPARAVQSSDYTYTRERDAWENQTLRIRVGP
jgi:hypothetical protein